MKLFSNVFPISNIKDYLGIDIYLENPRIFLTDKGSELLLIATEHTHKPMNGGQISFIRNSEFAKLLLDEDVADDTYNDLFTSDERYNHVAFSSIFVNDHNMQMYLKHLSNEGSILYIPNFIALAEEAEARYITKKYKDNNTKMLLHDMLESYQNKAEEYSLEFKEEETAEETSSIADKVSNIITYNGKSIDTLSPRYVNLLTLFRGNEEFAKKLY